MDGRVEGRRGWRATRAMRIVDVFPVAVGIIVVVVLPVTVSIAFALLIASELLVVVVIFMLLSLFVSHGTAISQPRGDAIVGQIERANQRMLFFTFLILFRFHPSLSYRFSFLFFFVNRLSQSIQETDGVFGRRGARRLMLLPSRRGVGARLPVHHRRGRRHLHLLMLLGMLLKLLLGLLLLRMLPRQ